MPGSSARLARRLPKIGRIGRAGRRNPLRAGCERRAGADPLPGNVRLDAGCGFGPHPVVHRIQHLIRHREPEAPDPRSRHGVGVTDRPRRGRVMQVHPPPRVRVWTA